MSRVGIIGFGRMGQLMAQHLTGHCELIAYDNVNKLEAMQKYGVKSVSLKEACQAEIVILSVPISLFQDLLLEIKDLLVPNALVIDVCSVKEYPLGLMKAILPYQVQILGTHPMFGPDSASESLKNAKIVICPVRIEKHKEEKIENFLKSLGLIVVNTSSSDHDRQISETLMLTHFIGRTLIHFEAKEHLIDTEGYKRLMRILETVQNDTWQLFSDMYRYNPYARETIDQLMQAFNAVEEKLRP